jgi:hypothetical protein
VYDYPQLDGLEGLFYVDIVDASTIGKGKNGSPGVILASTVFEDHISTDLEMVGMPLASTLIQPPHRNGPRDGLVDAVASLCLVGTVDLLAVGNDPNLNDFFFDLVIDEQSEHQAPGNGLLPFIDRLETVSTRGFEDFDTGWAPAPGGMFYTTAGNIDITPPVSITSLDGTTFDVTGPTSGPKPGTEVYRVTVATPGRTEARFEYCARINENAGDADNGTDGFITSNPETGGTEASPINVVKLQPPDEIPPICEVVSITNEQVKVHVQDPDSGLQSIDVTIADNVSVVFNPATFSPGTNDLIEVLGNKDDLDHSARLELRVTDVAGNVTVCDPVVTVKTRGFGRPENATFTELPEAESLVTVSNDSPGIRNLDVVVNGQRFKIAGLGNGEEITMDVSSAMVEGYNNTIALIAYGRPGASALIVIHD